MCSVLKTGNKTVSRIACFVLAELKFGNQLWEIIFVGCIVVKRLIFYFMLILNIRLLEIELQ